MVCKQFLEKATKRDFQLPGRVLHTPLLYAIFFFPFSRTFKRIKKQLGELHKTATTTLLCEEAKRASTVFLTFRYTARVVPTREKKHAPWWKRTFASNWDCPSAKLISREARTLNICLRTHVCLHI